MRFTNKYNLPDTIMRAALITNERYDKGNVERSVTQLITPPRIDILRKAHFREMEKDLSEEWWALFGSAVHHILELGAANNQTVEQRLYAEIDGWPISGKADLREDHNDGSYTLSDYKVTTAFQLMKDEDGLKVEWEQQLNMLAYLTTINMDDAAINALEIVAIVRDWQRSQAQADPGYPIAPVVKIKVPVWPYKDQEAFLRERVREHRNAEMMIDLDLPLPECSDEERWSREHTWAVIKDGGKRAAKVYDNQAEAEADAAKRTNRRATYVVDYRPGRSVRCEGNYCQVAQWCDQYQRMRETDDEEQRLATGTEERVDQA